MVRVGMLGTGVNPRGAYFFVAFEQRLRELGYVEGQNLTIDFRATEGAQKLHDLAVNMVRERPDVMVVGGPEAPLKALRDATTTIPIVLIALNFDPVAKGYIQSLARPGGNITGVFQRTYEVAAKQVELFREALPKATRFVVLWEAFANDELASVEARARAIGVAVEMVETRPPYDLEAAFAAIARSRPDGVLALPSPVFFRERARLASLALRHRLPLMDGRDAPRAGALMGFGIDLAEIYRRAADYVDKILNGAKPADLPVEQSTKFELVINLKTAKALGLTIPQSLLVRADEVLQ
jgi:putative ABC transport system substrate-binding protein